MKFLPEGRRVTNRLGDDILDTARRANVDFLGPCAGRALCARCVLRVVEGGELLSAAGADEVSVLHDSGISLGQRLGCRARLVREGEVVAFIPSQSRLGTSVLLSEGAEPSQRFDPVVRKLRVPVATGRGPEPAVAFTEQARTNLSRFGTGDEAREAFLVEREGEVLDARTEGHVLGLAVDVGTTKVAGYLVDLEDGRTLSVATEINPQIAYGEDVIARLTYAIEGGQEELQARIVECINSIAARASKTAGVRSTDIYEFVIVGNTVMHHLLLKLGPKAIAYAPYTPVSTESRNVSAASLNLAGNREARVFMPPLIAGYVGSDAVADVLATGLQDDLGPSMLVDIGTNTEIVLKSGDKFLACSAASGPAFEGAHITFGMRAATGAIDRVEISAEGEPSYTVIGGGTARGLAGSAVVDALAELSRAGIIEGSGAFVRSPVSARLREGSRGFREYVIAKGSGTGNQTDITVNQKDIREVQLAKAAIRAGIDVLLGRAGVEAKDLRAMYVAGAFGFFLNPVTARALGLYPEVELDRVRMVGNTAVTGAKALLVSGEMRKVAESLSKRISYVELAKDPNFRREFMDAMPIPHAPAGTKEKPRAGAAGIND